MTRDIPRDIYIYCIPEHRDAVYWEAFCKQDSYLVIIGKTEQRVFEISRLQQIVLSQHVVYSFI